jgi:hypothetical protein
LCCRLSMPRLRRGSQSARPGSAQLSQQRRAMGFFVARPRLMLAEEFQGGGNCQRTSLLHPKLIKGNSAGASASTVISRITPMIATLVATNRRLALFPGSFPAPESPIVALFRSSAAERGAQARRWPATPLLPPAATAPLAPPHLSPHRPSRPAVCIQTAPELGAGARHGGRGGAVRYRAFSSSMTDSTEDFASPKSMAVLGA